MKRGLITLLSCLALTMGVAQAQTGLVSHWQGEGNPNDSAGSNGGSLQGGVSYAPGQEGQAFSLAGSGYVQVPHSASLNPSGSFTISAWIYPTVDQPQIVVSKWGDRGAWGNQRAYLLGTVVGGKLVFAISDDAHQWDAPFHEFVTPPNVIQLNAWNHVSAIYDQTTGTRRIFVDGVEVASRQDAPITMTSSIADVTIGTHLGAPDSGESLSFTGRIDEVRFYDRALTALELTVPVADAGPTQIGNIGDTVQLDGSGSSDLNNNPLSYSWQLISQPSGSTALLSGASSPNPTLIPDVGGAYTVELVVNDGFSNSTPDQVTISVLPAELADFDLVYELDLPDDRDIVNSPFPYSTNNSGDITYGAFDRIGYYLELDRGDGPEYIWVSMDPFTPDPTKIGVPTIHSGAVFQTTVDNMNVSSNLSGITTGTGITTGNIEFWPHQYKPWNGNLAIPIGNRAAFDFNDRSTNLNRYGSMQIHNYGAGQTLFSYNRWELRDGHPDDLGIGNNSGPHSDWTLARNADEYSSKVMRIYVRPAPMANAGADQFAFIDQTVQLDGTGSISPDNNPLTYNWQLVSQPNGSTASLSDAASPGPTLVPDVGGPYVVQLIVSNGVKESTPDQVVINVALQDGLVGYWQANGDYTDASGYSHHGQPTGTISFGPGEDGQAFVFSRGGRVQIANTPHLNLGFEQTISCRYKWSGNGTTWQRIVGRGQGAIQNYGLWIHPNGTHLYQIWWSGSPYARTPQWTAQVQFTAPLDTEWHHMMGTIEGQTIKLYLDGELVASNTALPLPPHGFLTEAPVVIGGQVPGGDPFNGSVDEVAIYNRALDGYSEFINAPNFEPIARAGADQSAFAGDIVQFDGNGSSDVENAPLTYDWQLISQPNGSTASLSGATSATPTLTPDVAGQYVVQLVVNDGALDSAPDQVTIDVKLESDLVGYWAASDDYTDASGWGHHGQPVGPVAFSPGQEGQAFSLDGSSYVQVPHSASFNPSGGLTISAWIYPTVDQPQIVVSKWGDRGAWDNQRAYLLGTIVGGKLVFAISDDAHQWDAPFHEFVTPPNVIQLNAWNHVTAVYYQSTGTRRIFVDGVEVASRQDAPITMTSSIADFTIGAHLGAPDSGGLLRNRD
jgi:hypothetical protein